MLDESIKKDVPKPPVALPLSPALTDGAVLPPRPLDGTSKERAASKPASSGEAQRHTLRMPSVPQSIRAGSRPTFGSNSGLFAGYDPKILEWVASTIHGSLREERGLSRLQIPEGIPDLLALRALNYLFRKKWHKDRRDAIHSGDIRFYSALQTVTSRDIDRPRHICLQAVVPGTERLARNDQKEALAAQGMVFADPFSVALVAAAHACARKRVDLLQKRWIRTSVEGVALATDSDHGIMVVKCDNVVFNMPIAAAGE